MGDGQEQDQYEERLKELFNSFDASGGGSLSHEELSDLCQSLHLDDATPALIQALLEDQDCLTDRVDFERFKNTLILFLSSTIEPPQTEQETLAKPDSPLIRPKFVKGSKRYGRRSTPEFIEPATNLFQVSSVNPEDEALEDNDDSAVPRKRERWNAHETTEEYEAEGQMQLWNPDEANTPRGSLIRLSAQLEERLREACDELDLPWGGSAEHSQLIALCEHVGLEIAGDMLLALDTDTMTNVQEFVSMVINNNKPVTPSASTPYRQLKRLHSTQPFDEGGRRTTLSSTMGIQLFSTLDDGAGYTPVECLLDAWTEEGIENSAEVLQALHFDLDGKLSLGDLTMALESELLVTKNGIHQAALASFKAEIRHLGECMEREIREKDKIRSDLEKAERLKSQFASEMDEHHSAIELSNNLHLRKLEQEYKDKLTAVRSELRTEMDLIQQQAGLQRDELEAELQKIKEEESLVREHLSISLKENRRLETELLDSTEKLFETQNQMSKLQTNLDNLSKDKYGGLDQGSADFFLQEERIKELRCSYEAQCRELQDRIDELQSELQDFHSLDRSHQSCNKPLSEELESKSPGMDSDPGIGSEDVRPFSMSLESEMMLEQLKEQHQQEVDECRNLLQTKIMEFDQALELQRATHLDQRASMILQHQQEIQALQQEMMRMKNHTLELQAEEREEELGGLRQQLLEAHTYTVDLEEQLKNLESEQAEADKMMVELRRNHLAEVQRLKDECAEQLETRLLEERAELEQRLSGDWAREKKLLKESHEQQLEEVKMRFEEKRRDLVKSLTEQWQKEKTQLDEQNTEALQGLLEEEMLKMVFEQEEKEKDLRVQWEREYAQLQQQNQEEVQRRLKEERSHFEQRERRMRKQWDMERLQLEEDYEGMIQERVSEEKEKLQAEREEDEKQQQQSLKEERERLEERHREAVKELRTKHAEERDSLSSTLDKLGDDIAMERRETELSFNRKIKEMAERFAGDQESMTQRFQADVRQVEQHYQTELKELSKRHAEKEVQWEAQKQNAFQGAEEHDRMVQEAREQELERLSAEWFKDRQELQRAHSEEVEAMRIKNKQQLDEFLSKAKTKEIELRQLLNNLHNRLQESLDTKQLLSQSEDKAVEMELLLNQTVEDFKDEREDLLNNYSELEAKYSEMLSISDKMITERMELQTECNVLRVKNKELEMLLKQAAVDFELERTELQENVDNLQILLKESQSKNREEVRADHGPVTQGEVEDTSVEMKMLEGVSEFADHFVIQLEQDGNTETDNELPSAVYDGADETESHTASDEDEDRHLSVVQGDETKTCQLRTEKAVVSQKLNLDVKVGCDGHLESSDPWHDDGHHGFSDSLPCTSYHHLEAPVDRLLDGNQNETHSQLILSDEVFENGGNERFEASTEENKPQVVAVEYGPSYLIDKLESAQNPVKEENILLHQKISLLQQKTEILENLLSYNSEKIKAFHQVLEENYSLKVKMLLLMEHNRDREMEALKMADLLIQYEECLCENAKLKDQNIQLKRNIWLLEAGMDVLHNVRSRQVCAEDEIGKIKEENMKQNGMLSVIDLDSEGPETPPTGPNGEVNLSGLAAIDLDDCCLEFERENGKLRLAISELQDQSQTLDETTQAHRSELHRLADENAVLSQKIAALKNEDLQEEHDKLLKTLNHLKKEKFAAQKAAENGKKQISGLRLQNQKLENDNKVLSEENARSSADVESLRQQLENRKREALPAEERTELAACISALEAELTKALEDSAQLEERNIQLSQQLESREKVKLADETLQALNRHSSRLKSDLRALQQERDSLQQEVAVLNKQLQNATDKNRVLERALQHHSKTLYRDETDHDLRQENERLRAEVCNMRGDLVQCREKVCQLDATIVSLKQHKQQSPSSLMKALEQENVSLKQELQAQSKMNRGEAGRLSELQNLQQENEALKTRIDQLSSQLLETLQAQLLGLLPPSPHRLPRGQHRGEEPDVQSDREKKMKMMEGRMKEIELSLQNVKVLLKEKVVQLKEQLHKNSKSDVLIRDLYVENTELLKALELTEQRQNIAEKKNYLLEEKISSLNKIVRELSPSPLPSLPYLYKCP